jgi:type II restriction enzyme
VVVKLVRYQLLGFNTEEEYLKHFLDTLLETNWTYEYFVDWDKVRSNVKSYVKEICLLNALTKIEKEKRESELKDIFLRYPETIKVIPLLIAVRENSIPILEISEKAIYKVFDFKERKLSPKEAEELVHFCRNVGILDLFAEINDLYAYLLGIEVGLDTNARKNRSGKIFENLVELLLNRKLAGIIDLRIKKNDKSVKISRSKNADFVIYYKGEPKVIIECSFYSETGSKPIETANSYIDLQKKIQQKNIYFIWITDGRAWKSMENTLNQVAREIDFLLNYNIASEKIDKLIQHILSDKNNSRQL